MTAPATGSSPDADARARRVTGEAELAAVNRRFYEALWARSRVVPGHRFNTWPVVEPLASRARARLEVGPGLRPRLPLEGTEFIDVSAAAVEKLRACGGRATVGAISRLPFPDGTFDLIAAFDILEHVEDDGAVLDELSRVAAPASTLLLSAPLHESKWTAFDDLVGHRRRYAPEEIREKLALRGWRVDATAVFGMQPRSSRLLDWSVWQLQNKPDRAIWVYDRIMLPLAAFFQKPLDLVPGMQAAADDQVDEILLVCRREPESTAPPGRAPRDPDEGTR